MIWIVSHYDDLHVFYTRHHMGNWSGRCVSVSVAWQTHLRKLIFSSNFSLFVQKFPRRAPCEYTSQEIEWHPLLLRGFYFVQPGRWTVLLICPDAAMLVDLLLAQAKQTEEEGRIVWLPLNLLWKSFPPSSVSRHNCSSNLCFYTHLICFAVQMNMIIRPGVQLDVERPAVLIPLA